MSNPTTLVEQFDGSLGAFTGVDPIRYDDGLWLEQATTNYVRNPLAVVDTTNWLTTANGVLSVETLPAAIPDEYGLANVENCFAFTASNNIVGGFTILSSNLGFTLTAAVHTQSWLIYVPTAFSGTEVKTYDSGHDVGATRTSTGDVNLALRDQWQRVAGVFTPGAGDLTGNLLLVLRAGTMMAGEVIYFVGVQTEAGAYATSITPEVDGDGDPIAGYAFTGTAHNSSSTRAASSASVATAGHLDPSSGAIAMRIQPTIETGVEELWGEAGVKGAATDHVRWGRDATKHPFVEWSANNAAYQRLTATETVDADTEHFFYFGHDGTATSLQVDSGTLQTGTRAAVSASFGAGELTLQASAGGVIVSPFATFDRLLTDTEIATLD